MRNSATTDGPEGAKRIPGRSVMAAPCSNNDLATHLLQISAMHTDFFAANLYSSLQTAAKILKFIECPGVMKSQGLLPDCGLCLMQPSG
jgi:hypothetical protein